QRGETIPAGARAPARGEAGGGPPALAPMGAGAAAPRGQPGPPPPPPLPAPPGSPGAPLPPPAPGAGPPGLRPRGPPPPRAGGAGRAPTFPRTPRGPPAPIEPDARLAMMTDVSAGREHGQTGAAAEPERPSIDTVGRSTIMGATPRAPFARRASPRDEVV